MNSICISHPSLALSKYWGKQDCDDPLPATPSLAVSLDQLYTKTTVQVSHKGEDQFFLNGYPALDKKIKKIFDLFRQYRQEKIYFTGFSENNFLASAGLASSSSGICSLVGACQQALDLSLNQEQLSAIARFGSLSSVRSFLGGFCELPAGQYVAQPYLSSQHWSQLKVVIFMVQNKKKMVGSTQMMKQSQNSLWYPFWVEKSAFIHQKIKKHLLQKNLFRLSYWMQMSYQSMFSVIHTAYPNHYYWDGLTLDVLRFLNSLQDQGYCLAHTMDAGAQVKVFIQETELKEFLDKVQQIFPEMKYIVSGVGAGMRYEKS